VTYFLHTGWYPPALRVSSQNGRPFQEIKRPAIQLFADFRILPAAGMVLRERGDSASIRKL
jgi:hypothetical protein